jgi:ATP-dependent DNA helicase RecG
VALIGGQKKSERESIINEIKNGKAKIIIGTHALIEENVEFYKPGLIVIDEQHRFGVEQRSGLIAKIST